MNKGWKIGVVLTLCCVLIATLVLPSVSANTIDKNRRELDSVKQELKEGKEDLKEVKLQEQELAAKVKDLERSISKIQQELASLARKVKTTEEEIEVTEAELIDAEERLVEREGLLNTRIRAIYELGSVNILEVILDSNSFSDFLTRFNHLQLIVDQDTQLLEVVKQEREEIALQKEELEEKRGQLLNMRRQSLAKKDQVEAQKSEHAALLVAVQEEYEKQERFIAEMEREAKEIEKIIKELEEAQRRASRAPTGQLVWPLANYGMGSISSPFGNRIHPITGRKQMHWGIDIAVPRGTPIRAAANGVAYSYYGSSYGNYVIIIHGGGMSTLYAHNSRNAVSSGQQVQAGQTIAYIGSTGASTGPHVHFEVRVNGQRVNPLNYYR